MGSLVHDCPHCGAKKVTFDLPASSVVTARHNPFDPGAIWNVFGSCRGCLRGAVFFAQVVRAFERGDRLPSQYEAADFSRLMEILRVWPTPTGPHTINHLPEAVGKDFAGAEECIVNRQWVPAGIMFRRTMERALKSLDENGTGTFAARIRALEGAQKVPESLIGMLDSIRFLGNDAAHADDDPTEEEVRRAREFVRLFLTYTFELPNEIAAAANDRAVRRAGTTP